MLVTLLAVLLIALLGIGGAVLVRGVWTVLESRLGGIEATLEQREAMLEQRLGALDEKVDRRLEGLDGRLLSNQQSAGQAAAQIAERLVRLDGAAAQMLQRAGDLARLEHALRPPKARGGVGELLLANLLRECLPAEAYELQHTFRTGDRVDAVIKADRLVPIDAKFPLDNFERLVNADGDSERQLHEKAFARDVKGHIDAIASKYIRPGENTFDFALMYLPSEAVYYELVCGRTGGLYTHALGKRVFPVSPSTFHPYLAMIVLGLRGLQIERSAQEVMAYCAQLGKDFERFREDFEVVGKHIGNAQSKFGEAHRRLERLEGRLELATEVAPDDAEPLVATGVQRALDAA